MLHSVDGLNAVSNICGIIAQLCTHKLACMANTTDLSVDLFEIVTSRSVV